MRTAEARRDLARVVALFMIDWQICRNIE